jgi:two-component system, NarL family, sensor histidine kinase DevS
MSGGPQVNGRLGLDRVVERAREITRARYAALAVLNEQRDGLAQFLTAGVDEDARRAIGHTPRGRGVLGELILDPLALRLGDVTLHPSSYGFPPAHPVMRSFLGVPIMIPGRVLGSLYLAEKAGGDFSEADEAATVALAEQAASMISFLRRGPQKAVVG